MAVLTDEAIRLLQGKNLAYLATTNEDGSPHVMPLWVDVDVERDLVLFNTADGRQKARNVRRDPRVMVASHDRRTRGRRCTFAAWSSASPPRVPTSTSTSCLASTPGSRGCPNPTRYV